MMESRNLTNDLRIRRLVLVGMMLSLCLGISFTSLGGAIGSTLPLSFTFIIKAPALNIYQAFVSGGNPTIPLFQESNFTRLMYDDVEHSSFCTNGCSMTFNPGMYNQTQKIPIDRPTIKWIGTSAARILPQPTFTTPALNVTVSGASFGFDGLRLDDFARKFLTPGCSNLAGTACHIPIAVFAPTCSIKNAQIFNITTVGVYLTISSNSCDVASNIITGIPAQFTNATQGVMQGIEASGMNQKIEFNTISYIRGGAAIRMGAGTTNNAVHNFAQGNTLFHNEYGLASFRGVDIRMTGNTIYNSTGYGLYLDSGIAAPNVWGPISITGNTISESGQGLCCGALPGTLPHIELRGTRCCWYSVSITGNSMLDRQSNMTTKWDIEVLTQNYRNLTITGNSAGTTRATPTIILQVNPPDKSWIITANPGFNPQPVRGPLTAGATPFTYTNNDGYMEQIELITIGDMTAFTCRGIANIIQVDAISPVLNTLDTCVFTYVAVAPTYDVLPMQG